MSRPLGSKSPRLQHLSCFPNSSCQESWHSPTSEAASSPGCIWWEKAWLEGETRLAHKSNLFRCHILGQKNQIILKSYLSAQFKKPPCLHAVPRPHRSFTSTYLIVHFTWFWAFFGMFCHSSLKKKTKYSPNIHLTCLWLASHCTAMLGSR